MDPLCQALGPDLTASIMSVSAPWGHVTLSLSFDSMFWFGGYNRYPESVPQYLLYHFLYIFNTSLCSSVGAYAWKFGRNEDICVCLYV